MAQNGEKHDLIDDLVDMKRDWDAVSNPLGTVTSALSIDPDAKVPTWNPSNYKVRPRANVANCTRCASHDASTCSACIDVCPVNGIEIEGFSITIPEDCRKCGLCVAACPSEAFIDYMHTPRKIYDEIAQAAMNHEQCYVTCTRALGRIPRDNEIVLPCVGVVPPEVWFALMVDHDNVNVYLPLGICDKCRTVTGEEVYVKAIGQAEEWSGRSVGLECDPEALNPKQKRGYERRQLMSSIMETGKTALAAANPMVGAARAAAKALEAHTEQINALQRTVDDACGVQNSQLKRRVLVQRRQIMMGALQHHASLAKNISYEVPACDPTKCTLCGECVNICPVNALDLSNDGRLTCESTHCMSCGACVHVCEEGALTMVPGDTSELVVPDVEAQRRAANLKERREQMERLKKEGMRKLSHGLDILEKLDSDDD